MDREREETELRESEPLEKGHVFSSSAWPDAFLQGAAIQKCQKAHTHEHVLSVPIRDAHHAWEGEATLQSMDCCHVHKTSECSCL